MFSVFLSGLMFGTVGPLTPVMDGLWRNDTPPIAVFSKEHEIGLNYARSLATFNPLKSEGYQSIKDLQNSITSCWWHEKTSEEDYSHAIVEYKYENTLYRSLVVIQSWNQLKDTTFANGVIQQFSKGYKKAFNSVGSLPSEPADRKAASAGQVPQPTQPLPPRQLTPEAAGAGQIPLPPRPAQSLPPRQPTQQAQFLPPSKATIVATKGETTRTIELDITIGANKPATIGEKGFAAIQSLVESMINPTFKLVGIPDQDLQRIVLLIHRPPNTARTTQTTIGPITQTYNCTSSSSTKVHLGFGSLTFQPQ